jgi:predicted ATPase/class 3 adenylate cyclase
MKCPRCQYGNPPEAKFCLECGRALIDSPAPYTPRHLTERILASRTAMEGERKQVTVVFCDVVGSTALAQRLGPEGFHELIDAFFTLALSQVHRYEGTVNQFLGDGFMALFGAPIAHEDHARRAALAALGIRAAVAEQPDLSGIPGGPLRLRMGLNTGLVVVGRIGDDLRMDYTAFGDTTILAARLESAGEPDEILLSEKTAELITGYCEVSPREAVTIKGQGVRPYRLMGVGERRSKLDEGAGAPLSRFVGRQPELELLTELLERARNGAGQVASIAGEPGIGKSRLALEFRRLIGQDCTWLEGRCVSFGRRIPYLPILDLVRELAGITPSDARDEIREKIRATVTDLGIDVDTSLPYLLHLLGDPDATDEFAELDPATIKGGTFGAARALCLGASHRQLLVLLIEDLHWIDRTSEEFLSELLDGVSASPILALTTYRPGYEVPWSGKPFVSELTLPPLGLTNSEEVTNSILDKSDTPASVTGAIVKRGEGNPFFLEELARAARDLGDDAAAFVVPGTVQDVLAARIDRLDDDSKRAVQVGAVLGREFPRRVLQAMWDGPEDVVFLLREPTRLGFLREGAGGAVDSFSFTHALTQEVAYDSLLVTRRQALHGRAAAAIERLYGDRLDEHYEVLAYHYSHSVERELAARYLELANRKAAERNAMEEALGYFYEALGVLEELPDTPENRRRRVALVLEQTGEFHFLHRHREYYEVLLRHEPLVLELADEALLGGFFARLGHRQWVFAEFRQAEQTLGRARDLCERAGNVEDAAAAHMLLEWTLLFLGDYRRARLEAERALEKLAERFHPIWYMNTRVGVLISFALQGRWDDAVREGRQTIAAGRERSNSAIVSFSASLLADAYLRRRDWNHAFEYAQLALHEAPTLYFEAFAQAFTAAALCHTGEPEQGVAGLSAIVPLLQASEHVPSWMHIAPWLAEGRLILGDYNAARDVLESLVEVAERTGAPFYVGTGYRLLADVALSQDAEAFWSEASSDLGRAIDVLRPIGAENELGFALASQGRLWRRLGRESDGRARLEDALSVFERLGTLEEPDRLRSELATASTS